MHHAYLQEGPLSLTAALAADARERFGFAAEHNPDVHVREYEKFGIDDAHALVSLAQLRSASGRALYIYGVGSATVEAQQTLLKLLEEPQQGAVFVLLMPHGLILPTLRSRTLPYPGELEAAAGSHKAAKEFLAGAYSARSAYITKMLKDDEGAKERARELLGVLESVLYKRGTADAAVRAALGDIAKVRGYLADRSPSLKMLLEHLAATLPKV